MVAVSAVIVDAENRVLLVQRGHEPALGQWSLPGGSVEAGESMSEALRREVREETGLEVVVVGGKSGVQRWISPPMRPMTFTRSPHALSAGSCQQQMMPLTRDTSQLQKCRRCRRHRDFSRHLLQRGGPLGHDHKREECPQNRDVNPPVEV